MINEQSNNFFRKEDFDKQKKSDLSIFEKYKAGIKIKIIGQFNKKEYGEFALVNRTPLEVGKTIYLDDHKKLGTIVSLSVKDASLCVSTEQGDFILKLPKNKEEMEAIPLEEIDSIVTKKGSIYKYLPNGTTQRFKKVEQKYYDPQQALVFVPDWNWVKNNLSKSFLDSMENNEGIYEQILLEYAQLKENTCYIVDSVGSKLDTNEKIKKIVESGGDIFLALCSDEKVNFTIPVTNKPKIGFSTFDTRKFKDEKTGELKREEHLGNKVIEIIGKS